MRLLITTLLPSATCTAAVAAPGSCDELQAEIAAVLAEKGVKHDVGSCDGGTKKLTDASQ